MEPSSARGVAVAAGAGKGEDGMNRRVVVSGVLAMLAACALASAALAQWGYGRRAIRRASGPLNTLTRGSPSAG